MKPNTTPVPATPATTPSPSPQKAEQDRIRQELGWWLVQMQSALRDRN